MKVLINSFSKNLKIEVNRSIFTFNTYNKTQLIRPLSSNSNFYFCSKLPDDKEIKDKENKETRNSLKNEINLEKETTNTNENIENNATSEQTGNKNILNSKISPLIEKVIRIKNIKISESEKEEIDKVHKEHSLSPQEVNILLENKTKEDSYYVKRKIRFSVIKDKNNINPFKNYQLTQDIGLNKNYISFKKVKPAKSLILKGNDSIVKRLIQKIINIFMPQDYPHSVSQGYQEFAYYNFVYNLVFFYLNFMSIQIAIESLGISMKTSAVFASAGLNWALKEGAGQICSIYGVAKLGKAAERNAKEWRGLSLVVLQLAFFVDLSILLLPQYFIYLAAFSAFLKITSSNISIVTRTAVYIHVAKKNNLVDLLLKHQNQTNVAIFIGNFLGFLTTYYLDTTFDRAITLMLLGTAITFYSLNRANSALIVNDFNYQRLYYFCKLYLVKHKIPSPKDIGKCESMLFRPNRVLFCIKSPEFLMHQNKKEVFSLVNIFKKYNFICYPKHQFSLRKMGFQYNIYTFLKINYTDFDILKAFMLSVKLEEAFSIARHFNEEEIVNIVVQNLEFVDKHITHEFMNSLPNEGWKLQFGSVIKNKANFHIIDVEE